MEGKWIEGFNKRYKIFEDGSIVSYVYKNPRIIKGNKYQRIYLTNYGDKKKINLGVLKLMEIYFPDLTQIENWKWIKIEMNGIMYDFEGKYRIYKNGDVKSILGNIKIIKPFKDGGGYLFVNLSLGQKNNFKPFRIHRLIGNAFIPNPDNKPFIDHKDGNRLNNSIVNLRWVTRQENNLNAKNFGKYKKGVTKKGKKFISRIRINGKDTYIGTYETEEEAHEKFKEKFLQHHGFECCSR